jgi:acylphosphatase
MSEPRADHGNRVRIHASIEGRVQGVAFRWHCHRAACARGLGGWVRNTIDGGVELEVEGPPALVESFLQVVRKGPIAARVDAVETEERQPEEVNEFEIRY